MKKLKNPGTFFTVIFIVLLGFTAIAGKIGDDFLTIGKPNSTSDKTLTFDVGDGASNPVITVDFTNKDFDLNKALNILANQATLGDGTNTDKEWIFDIGSGANNPRFKWDSSNNVLSFANDGVGFKAIGSGSGSGGGINFLLDSNPDFETGTPPDDWTASGGTFIAETTNFLFGAASGSWDSNGLGQTLDSQLVPIPPGVRDLKCQAEIRYSYPTGTSGDYKLVVRKFDDSLATEVDFAEVDLNVTTEGSKPAQLFFDCPDDAADDLRIRIESTVADADLLLVDQAFLGFGKNIFQLSQSELITQARYDSTSGCDWARDSASFGSFSTDASCPAIEVIAGTGTVDTTDDDLPTLKLDNLKPGIYSVEVLIPITHQSTAANVEKLIRIFDVTGATALTGNCLQENRNLASGTDLLNFSCMSAFTLTEPVATKTLEIQAAEDGTGSIVIDNQNSANLIWKVTKYPLNSAEAITLETSGGSLVAFHLEDCIFSTTSATYTLPNEDATCGFTVREQSGAFSNVQTLNNPTNPTSGITFDSNRNADVWVCANTGNGSLTPGESVYTLLQNETINEGIADHRNEADGNTPATLCGKTRVVAGSNEFRLELKTTGGATGRLFNVSGNAAIAWHVIIVGDQFPSPIFTDLQNSLDSKVETNVGNTRFCSFNSGSTGASGGADHTDCIVSATAQGGATLRVVFNTNTFLSSGDYACSCTANHTAEGICTVEGKLDDQIDFATYVGGTPTNLGIEVLCHGVKGD